MKQKLTRVQKQFSYKYASFLANGFVLVIKPFSQFFRRVFEFGHINRIYGLTLILFVLLLAITPTFWSINQTLLETRRDNQVIAVEIKTEKSVHLPIEEFTITQGFRFLHPGLDLAAVKGSPVYPIMDGTVEKVTHDRWTWGNYVIVNHGSGLKSVYAHLAKIEVREGEKLEKNLILGLVGSTGWSTGPHLHLQVMQDGNWVNPKAFFEGYFGKRLASTR